jgi:hypothetical protein
MASASMTASTLRIERLHTCYLVPAECQTPEEVRVACEGAIAATLPDALATALEQWLPADDPSVWLVRRLAVDFSINAEVNLPGLPQICARETTAALMDTLQSGGPDVLHFPDYAAYLAHFLLDLVEGSAWGKWYYQRFDGLRMLPVSAAVRTAVCDRPDAGWKALSSLTEAGCAAVVRALSAGDADRILAAVAPSSETDPTACFQLICDAWQAVLTIPAYEEESRRLLLFLSVARKDPGLGGETLRAAATAVSRLAKCLHQGSSSLNDKLIKALQDGDLRALYESAGFDQATVLAPLLRCSPECRGPLLHRVAGDPVAHRETHRETRFTAFGGAFLLFPVLDRFPFEAATAGWPDLGNVSATTVVRFLTLAGCFGTTRALGCFRDPLLRDLMQFSPQIDAALVADWLAGLSSDHLATFTREIAGWLLETGAAEGEIFEFVSVSAEDDPPVMVILDSARGLWLAAGAAGDPAGGFSQALSHLPSPQKLQCHESLLRIARETFPEAQLHPESRALPELSKDLIYLALPRELCAHRQFDLALRVAAQNVLRLFASRLPGFARSTLNYLHSNFLDCSAAVEETTDQRVVCLGHPPLHLVLAMAGLTRCRYKLSWLNGPACAIFPEG